MNTELTLHKIENIETEEQEIHVHGRIVIVHTTIYTDIEGNKSKVSAFMS